MNSKRFFFFTFAILALALTCLLVGAQESQSLVTSSPTNDLNWLAPILNALGAKEGWLLAVVAWMGILRAICKPVMTQIEAAVKASPSAKDDQILAEVEASKGWKFFCWLLDFFASVKVGTQFTAKPILTTENTESTEKKNPGGSPNGIVTGMGMAFVILLLGSGCQVLDKAAKWVSAPVVSSVTNTVHEVTTNYVAVPVQVAGETRFVTNTIPQLVTNVVEKVVDHTNYVEKAAIADGLQAVKAGAAVTAVMAPQFGVPATAAAGVVGALVASLVAYRNKREAQAANASVDAVAAENANLNAQLHAVVTGVEDATSAIDPKAGQTVKDTIAKISKIVGVAPELDATVQAITKG